MVNKWIMVFISSAFLSNTALATPSEIIIIRHSDKLTQPKPGQCLSSQGIARSITFAFYFLKKFHTTDYIFATNPMANSPGNTSIRELQTVAPLANMLAKEQPDVGFPISHPYGSTDYLLLANELLHSKKYHQKRIVICWEHTKIPKLTKALGVHQKLAKWASSDYDTVYILKYNPQGNIKNFVKLNHQYPLHRNFTWQGFLQ